jgi:hypothetical protein
VAEVRRQLEHILDCWCLLLKCMTTNPRKECIFSEDTTTAGGVQIRTTTIHVQPSQTVNIEGHSEACCGNYTASMAHMLPCAFICPHTTHRIVANSSRYCNCCRHYQNCYSDAQLNTNRTLIP